MEFSYNTSTQKQTKEKIMNYGEYQQTRFLSSEKIKNSVIFTNYNTIKSDFFGELTVDDFFNKFEIWIKDRKIINCNLDLINNKLTFEIKDTKKTYNILIDEDEFEKIKTGIPSRNTRILLTLFDLEKDILYIESERLKQETINKKLLDEAKNGNVKNKRAQNLYIKELKKELKKKYHILKTARQKAKINIENNTNIISTVWKKWYYYSSVLETLLVVSLIFLALLLAAGYGYFLSKMLEFKIFLKISSSIFMVTIQPFVLKLSNNIAIFIKTLIDELRIVINDKKLIKHKIKTLQNMTLPEENISIEQTSKKEAKEKQEIINEKIKRLSILISKLSKENKIKMSEILLNKIENYKNRLNEIQDKLLVLETEEMIKDNYLEELDEFEQEIELLIKNEKEIQELNSTIDFLEKVQLSSGEETEEKKLTELNITIELLKEMKKLLNNNNKNLEKSKSYTKILKK